MPPDETTGTGGEEKTREELLQAAIAFLSIAYPDALVEINEENMATYLVLARARYAVETI